MLSKFFKKLSVQAMEDAAVKRAIANVIDKRTHYGFTGHPHVRKFEEKLSEMFGKPVIAMNSGTDALILALKLLGIGPGDEVIVPAFSFISSASAVPWVGATPVFADIREEDYAIDPAAIAEKITPKTKAIIVVHLFGQPAAKMGEILTIAKEKNLFVIEDAAQSFGAKIKIGGTLRHAGTVGNIGCLSFSSTKPFAAPGSGGALILNTEEPSMREEGDRMRFYGAKKHYYDYPTVGVNAKMHEIQAAALLAKLPFFEYWLEHRRMLADTYASRLAGIKELSLPEQIQETERTWYRYVIRSKKRDELFSHLVTAAGSVQRRQPSKNYPVPLPFFSAFSAAGAKPGDFPASEHAAREVISLPITNFVSRNDVIFVAEAIRQFSSL